MRDASKMGRRHEWSPSFAGSTTLKRSNALNRGGSHGSSCVGKRGNKIKRSSWRALTDRFCVESKEQEAVECRVSCIDFALVMLLPV